MGTRKKVIIATALWACLFAGIFFSVASVSAAKDTTAKTKPAKVRIGYFPNITHAQALILHSNGHIQKKFENRVLVDWKVFNAGPSAVEAIFAGNLDLAYIGPSPAVNAFMKSNGEAVRVVAGAASGGAALVTRGDLEFKSVQDFKGKKIASPQLGNTQDVALRSWLKKSGLTLKEMGGDVQVQPLSNADQQTLFIKKEIDAAWTVEPWVSLLIENAGGKIFMEESELWAQGKYATAVILARTSFLEKNPGLVKEILAEHVEITKWIYEQPAQAKQIISEELKKHQGKEIPAKVLDSAFSRILFTYEPVWFSIVEQAKSAHEIGFLKKEPDLEGLFDLRILEEVLKERNFSPIPGLEDPSQK